MVCANNGLFAGRNKTRRKTGNEVGKGGRMKDKAEERKILWCRGLLGGWKRQGRERERKGTLLTCATSLAAVRNVLFYRAKTTNYQHDIQNRCYEMNIDWHFRTSYCPCMFSLYLINSLLCFNPFFCFRHVYSTSCQISMFTNRDSTVSSASCFLTDSTASIRKTNCIKVGISSCKVSALYSEFNQT